MSELIESIERRQLRPEHPRFREGDRIRVHFQVVEGTRRRTQVFEGVVLRLQGPGARRTFTVRKLSFGVGVERTFPLHSPKVERIEVVSRGQVRRAKLYYLRGRIGRRARVRERRDMGQESLVTATPAPQEEAEAPEVEAEAAIEPGLAEDEAPAAGSPDEPDEAAPDAPDEAAVEEPAAEAEAEAEAEPEAATEAATEAAKAETEKETPA